MSLWPNKIHVSIHDIHDVIFSRAVITSLLVAKRNKNKRIEVEMVKSCSAVNCSKRCVKGNKIPFYTLPKDDERRMKWLTFLNRKKGTLPKPVYICGEHFVTGQKSNDKNHPDYVPSIAKSKPNIATSAPLISTSLKRSMRYRKILST